MTDELPDYCCAILMTPAGEFVFESRPETARHAAGKLTCFGGRRESGETPEACLLRELQEELDWNPAAFQKVIELRSSQRIIAWFYWAELNVPPHSLSTLPPATLVVATRDSLATLPISSWHRAVLEAWFAGEAIALVHEDE